MKKPSEIYTELSKKVQGRCPNCRFMEPLRDSTGYYCFVERDTCPAYAVSWAEDGKSCIAWEPKRSGSRKGIKAIADEKHIYLWKLKYAIRFEKLFALVAKGELDMINDDWQGWGDDFWWDWPPLVLHPHQLIREFFDFDSLPNSVKEFFVQPAGV